MITTNENNEQDTKPNGFACKLRPFLTFGYLGCVLALFSIILALYMPTLKLSIHIQGTEKDGAIVLYKTDTRSLLNYFQDKKTVAAGTDTLVFEDVPVLTSSLFLGVSGLDSLDIKDLSYECYGAPILHMDAESLYQQFIQIQEDERCSAKGGGCLLDLTKDEIDESMIQIDVPKAPLVLALSFYLIAVFIGSALFCLMISMLVKEHFPDKKHVLFEQMAGVLGIALFTVTAGELCNGGVYYISLPCWLLNFGIGICLFYVLVSILGIQMGGSIGMLVFFLFYVTNYYVEGFRGKPILSSDFYAIRTALDVVNGYEFKPAPFVILFLCAILFLLFFIWRKLPPEIIVLGLLKRILFLAVGAGLMFLVLNSTPYSELTTHSWEQDIIYAFRTQGCLPSFAKYAESLHVVKPDNYGEAALEQIVSTYSQAPKSTGPGPKRVLVIMNESFADMTGFRKKDSVNEMPNIDKLKGKIASGNLYVSVRGGGTCNTEFEALTGNSLVFLPPNTYPFQNYIRRPILSLASYFSSKGWRAQALHLEHARNWNRSNVYPLLSFDQFYSIDDYPSTVSVRDKATDSFDYSCLEDLANKENTFVFNVTIQNHGGYTNVDDLKVKNYYDKDNMLTTNVYLSLIKMSDDALMQLIKKYKDDPVDTMIVFFGDHQPSLGTEADQYLFDGNEEPLNHYKVPFFIWTNYNNRSSGKKKELRVPQISANYLPWLILKLSNLPIPPYWQLAGNVFAQYPVLTTQGIIDKDGKVYKNIKEVKDTTGLLKQYEFAQYNNLFDRHRLTELYSSVSD